MIETALFTHLRGTQGVFDIVGNRIYPQKLDQKPKEIPAVVYGMVSNIHMIAHGARGSGLATPRFQFACWASTYIGAKRLAEQVRLSLQGFKGTMGNEETVRAVHPAGDTDIYSFQTDSHRVDMDFEIWHKEAVPS